MSSSWFWGLAFRVRRPACPDSALRSRASFPTTLQHAHMAVGASPGATSRSTVQFAQALVSDFRAAEMDLAFLSGRPSSGAEPQASRLDWSAVHECVPLTSIRTKLCTIKRARKARDPRRTHLSPRRLSSTAGVRVHGPRAGSRDCPSAALVRACFLHDVCL
jgi:hypothetical protein